MPVQLYRQIRARAAQAFERLSSAMADTERIRLPAADEPLRSGLLSADQMQLHGKTLAGLHRLSRRRFNEQLLPRLAANEAAIADVCGLLTLAVTAGRPIAPAAEWLLDNYYLINEQIRTAKAHLPKGYSRELPRLDNGSSRDLPRVYDLAIETISHGDGRVDPDTLSRFVAAYQTVSALTLGELWAIPIMLRLSLIENLRRIAVRVAAGKADRDLAGAWADRMIETAERDPKGLILVIADMARSQPPMSTAFVAEFERRLRGQSPALALPLTWIEQLLGESHLSIEQLVQTETQQQAADQVSVSNSIASLRFLSTMDWSLFVEALSGVEAVLRTDPAAAYPGMDFASRDAYRHAIERIARLAGIEERVVAQRAIAMAAAVLDIEGELRQRHVGYFLVDQGLPLLERAAGLRARSSGLVSRVVRRRPLPVYLGVVALLSLLVGAALLQQAHIGGLAGVALALTGALALLSSSQLAVALTNWLATLLLDPRRLPRMDFQDGIPKSARTLVVVPCMPCNTRSAALLIEALEVRYLANRDPQLQFALLSDFEDAAQEQQPQDDALLAALEHGIDALNRHYSGQAQPVFWLFHRPRRWNPHEQVWMGRERKRGKLADLNALLLSVGADPEAAVGGNADMRCGPPADRPAGQEGSAMAFTRIIGDPALLAGVTYVITLDSDTQLPRDSARELVGTIAHPLNRAVLDPGRRRIVAGYGILQPRVAISLTAANRSRYARLCGGEPGIDPYTRAVSDVYQDLFAEGSFIGKGIYDLNAFEQVIGARMPANQILSHDLLEGCYARSGLLSDVQLHEGHPSRYLDDAQRRHRWVRGDWQLLGWLWRTTAAVSGPRERNPLTLLSRWKLFDNLRRSLAPAAALALLLTGWAVLASPQLWTLLVLAVLLVPSLCGTIVQTSRKPQGMPLLRHFAESFRGAGRHFAQSGLAIACLPFEAQVNLDAIVRTVFRLSFTRRHLLEWRRTEDGVPASGAACGGLRANYRAMWIGPALALLVPAGLAAAGRLSALTVAAPLLLLWALAPALTAWLSLDSKRRQQPLSVEQTDFLRRLARRTWAFFESCVGPSDHWLPPDNIQEHPVASVAHRTSPTNIGLALLGNLAAHDFGYLSAGELAVRTGHTLNTLSRLERFRSHFYNWYDTQTLQALHPTYVSTVDSGNLAGHLLTLRVGLEQLEGEPILATRWLEGLADTIGVMREVLGPQEAGLVQEFEAQLRGLSLARPLTLRATRDALEHLGSDAAALLGRIQAGVDVADGALDWAEALLRQCTDHRFEIDRLAPWTRMTNAPGEVEKPAWLERIPTLVGLSGLARIAGPQIEAQRLTCGSPEARAWLGELIVRLEEGSRCAAERIEQARELGARAAALVCDDYEFLYDKNSRLLAVGYNVDGARRDPSHYDLLASEARLCSFVAIAQGQVPQESWFALGRLLAESGGEPILLSWSGSMFEYLMPLLVMPTFEHTLLDRTYEAAVKRQIAYGRQRGVPWGISESGHNTVDIHLNYQYRAFGVPGLGLKRGLGDDLVVAPYASALALMVSPLEACRNLQRLAAAGLAGRFGLYEAVDFTAARLPRGKDSAIVRSFMAHHQGMSLLSLANGLLGQPMQRRFAADPMFQAVMLLLQERVPKVAVFHQTSAELSVGTATTAIASPPIRVLGAANSEMPEVQLLSNGRYHVMVTQAGGGYSRWKDLAVTRWQEDPTRDAAGVFCYIRDLDSGAFWSNAHQPSLAAAENYEAIFSEGRVEFRRREHGFETYTEIAVSPEDDIELRRVRVTNQARTRRTIEITSYAEVVMAPAAADALHPAFSKLFVQTELFADRHAILCTRRPRSLHESVPWMFHSLIAHGAEVEASSFETDRARFIGRGNDLHSPQALRDTAPLSGTHGPVLDPIVAIRYRISLEPQASVTLDMVIGMGDSREAALGLIDKYQDRQMADRVFELAWTHSQVLLRQINATESDAQLYARLANCIVYAHSSLRADAAVRLRNRRGQSGLWGYAISGDSPIVLLRITDPANIDLVRQLVQAHAYWRLKGLVVDLVIWNEDRGGYRQALQEQILGLIAAGLEAQAIDRPGGVFVRAAEHLSAEDRSLFESVARAIIVDGRGSLAEQLARRDLNERRSSRAERGVKRGVSERRASRLVPTRSEPVAAATVAIAAAAPLPALQLPAGLTRFNGLGGFSADGSEYMMLLEQGRCTPAPWVNVLANATFGTVVSEAGGAYTWSENAHEFRLTPWNNDPVCDASGEAFYLRDEDSGRYWSPTPLPRPGAGSYLVRHGFGYSVFEHIEDGIHSELTVFVSLESPVKYWLLELSNRSGRPRRLSATGFVEWVLGDLRAKQAMHIGTEVDGRSGTVFARNPFNSEFSRRTAFFAASDGSASFKGSSCTDRTEFIGRNGNLGAPAALQRTHLSTPMGMSSDACAALQLPVELADGQQHEVLFRLGAGLEADQAHALAEATRAPQTARAQLEAVRRHWRHTLSALQVRTPDPSIDVLVNGWLLYQTLACRLWARSGYYQSGGAYGFRDQLQDVMALMHAQPQLARAQLLLCASRQFREGDVQHWWHPPSGRGVRTRFADDFLWLPLAVCRYVRCTGDLSVLNGSIPYLEGRPVNADDDSYYDLPTHSQDAGSLYEHCVRAVRHGLRFGAHGLPLMGTGDWNDGMNRVGKGGRGESVWLGFFLCEVLQEFSTLASRQGDSAFAEQCIGERRRLAGHLEQHGWDGQWYRRAYFDDGTPLGSASNDECQIDSISQSWAVLSGVADADRSRTAMDSLDDRLVRRDRQLVQLLDPPFDRSALDPGYIRGYVPGVRENGGQYTHAAIWAAMAFAALGDSRRAWELTTMINPVNHAGSPQAVSVYKVEPYVVAADVYGSAPHAGRGGWTWYTGSAGWMYRLMVESLLGLHCEDGWLHFAPCLPPHWPGFSMRYRYRDTDYHIEVEQQPAGERAKVAATVLIFDGLRQDDERLRLVDDRREHLVIVQVIASAL